MPPKRPMSSPGPSAKRQRTALTLEKKLEIVNRAEAGEGNTALGRHFGLGESTIRNIKKNAEKIKSAVVDSSQVSSKIVTKVRNPIMTKMEKMLSLYIERETKTKTTLSFDHLRVKALEIYGRLCSEASEEVSGDIVSFNASRGWFSKFVNRHKLHNLAVRGEQANDDHEAVGRYPEQLRAMIAELGITPKQVFNADETGLFWKRMPKRTYISKDEMTVSGFKAAQDRLTLLMCSNAEGDCKMKPLVVYHSLNPPALQGLSKNMLPVHWAANKKAWVTGQIFEDWFANHFAVEAERYCREQNLAFKVLLLLDNAPAHPKHLDSIHPNITVRFLPPNTTSLIQPLDQGVIPTFKAYFLRRTFSQMLQATDGFEKPGRLPTVREWWKSLNIRHAINNIDESWREVKPSTLSGAWKSVWAEGVHTLKGFPAFTAAVQDCVALGLKIGGEGFSDLKTADVLELLDSHDEELSVDDLRLTQTEGDNDEEESVELQVKDFTVKQLGEFFKAAEHLAQMAMDMDPSLERSQHFSRSLQSTLLPYKQIYAEKQNAAKQTTLTTFFKPVSSAAGSSRSSVSLPSPLDDPDDRQSRISTATVALSKKKKKEEKKKEERKKDCLDIGGSPHAPWSSK
ncbi:tigger transposable element-derived protein 1-like isoform X2 [Hypanus sabinus]|uniref:tigger transposable element-derived protein 1-like isoform X2 n=1 Tax=Hypanus sabinus TaxID=79690 RepID=UPI0028C4C0E0|nr:tigger transposable element-derived protein 1-like isoform X2 [Hypanus sabinus]